MLVTISFRLPWENVKDNDVFGPEFDSMSPECSSKITFKFII